MPSQLDLFSVRAREELLYSALLEQAAMLRCQRCGQATMTKAQGDTYGICPGCGAIVARATRPRTLAGARG